MRRIATWTAALALALLATACSEAETDTKATDTAARAGACSVDALLACAKRSSIASLAPASPTKASGPPIVLGMVNQENTPAGSYPELSAATRAAVAFVNEQLGGVRGRPVELDVCNTKFSAEGSTSCAQRFVDRKVAAVLGGIDVFGNAIDTLGDNGIPYVGGIPVSMQSAKADNSFQWSGGTWGAVVAFAHDAAERRHAKKVAVVYGDFGSIADAANLAKDQLDGSGVAVQLVPYPVMTTDLSAALNAAAAGDPDAVFVLAADSACRAGFEGLAALGTRALRYFTGACASPAITEQVGHAKTEGAIFNVEGPISSGELRPDQALYEAIIAKYGSGGLDPIGAGTVTFRAFVNLYRVLVGLDGDPTPASVTAALRAQASAPSFNGHTSTCDRAQFDGLPAMCSPQQILAEMHDGKLRQVGDWIDVGALLQG